VTKICGVVLNEPDFQPAGVLEQIYDASWHENYICREMWHDRHAGLGHFNIGAFHTESQPLISGNGPDRMVYCGRIFDYGRMKTELRREGAEFAHEESDAEFMLNLIGRTGTARLREINGIYSLAHWDSGQKRLTLINDRYGLRPLYYWHDSSQGVLVFSSDLRGVMASGLVPRRPNWRAANVFLHFGHFLGEDTFFENVSLLPPAAVLRFEQNQVKIERYWNMAEIPIDETISYPQAVQQCGELFVQAVQRRIVPAKGKTVVFLSGGLDSGRIASELSRQKYPFVTYTSRGFSSRDPDGPVAAEVAKALQVENVFINLPARHFMNDYFPRTARLTDYETRLHQPYLPMIEALPGDCKVNFDGIAGDVAFNAVLRSSEFIDPDHFQAAQRYSQEQLAGKLIVERHSYSIFSPGIRRHFQETDVLETVLRELRKYAGTPNQLTCWYLSNRTRRAISLASLKLISLKAESLMPFYDNDLFDFVMSLPPVMRIQHSLRADMTQRLYPEFFSVFQSRQTLPAQGDDIRYYRQKREFLRWNTRRYFLGENWIFRNSRTIPRLVRDWMAGFIWPEGSSYLFNYSFLIFFEWLKHYFPRGQGLLDTPAE